MMTASPGSSAPGVSRLFSSGRSTAAWRHRHRPRSAPDRFQAGRSSASSSPPARRRVGVGARRPRRHRTRRPKAPACAAVARKRSNQMSADAPGRALTPEGLGRRPRNKGQFSDKKAPTLAQHDGGARSRSRGAGPMRGAGQQGRRAASSAVYEVSGGTGDARREGTPAPRAASRAACDAGAVRRPMAPPRASATRARADRRRRAGRRAAEPRGGPCGPCLGPLPGSLQRL